MFFFSSHNDLCCRLAPKPQQTNVFHRESVGQIRMKPGNAVDFLAP